MSELAILLVATVGAAAAAVTAAATDHVEPGRPASAGVVSTSSPLATIFAVTAAAADHVEVWGVLTAVAAEETTTATNRPCCQFGHGLTPPPQQCCPPGWSGLDSGTPPAARPGPAPVPFLVVSLGTGRVTGKGSGAGSGSDYED
ncbi:hypothetical protein F5X96DRAFT_673043 [Biscogniauxia mediterranea]|nr:hypothetical protein F5X96DRAFT_673043 [Biscogniauxia mediterranea]